MQRFLVILVGLIAAAPARADSDVEHARYSVVASSGTIEIRDYAPQIVAETTVAGERGAAISAGFRRLAGYIFGDNSPQQKIAMTAPVGQEPEGGDWKVRFTMPAEYSMANLPKPNSAEVKLAAAPGETHGGHSLLRTRRRRRPRRKQGEAPGLSEAPGDLAQGRAAIRLLRSALDAALEPAQRSLGRNRSRVKRDLASLAANVSMASRRTGRRVAYFLSKSASASGASTPPVISTVKNGAASATALLVIMIWPSRFDNCSIEAA